MANLSLLTQVKRDDIANAVDAREYPTSIEYWDAIIEAEIKAQRAKIVEWGEETCPHKTNPLEFRRKRFCDMCWQDPSSDEIEEVRKRLIEPHTLEETPYIENLGDLVSPSTEAEVGEPVEARQDPDREKIKDLLLP